MRVTEASRNIAPLRDGPATPSSEYEGLEAEWFRLSLKYLPIERSGSSWRFSRNLSSSDPQQGWKLHLSADILSANQVFERVAVYLRAQNILFKAPNSLLELKRINCGLFYGFSQVGKFVSVYARSSEEAVRIGRKLDKLTRDLPGPAVPFDQAIRANSRVSYRYGSFSLEMDGPEGRVAAILDGDGSPVPDRREPGYAVPAWVADPFLSAKPARRNRSPTKDSPLTRIRAFEALSQRGKGGVYRALDLSVHPARLCILKEGRHHGETDWDGRDGRWRVRHEAYVLSCLRTSGVSVPQPYASFEVEANHYVAMEAVEGDNLHWVAFNARRRPWPARLALGIYYGAAVARLLHQIHSAGWVWRDCKPLNLILSKGGDLRPVDFEGACLVDQLEPMPWGTNGYSPPEWLSDPPTGSRIPEDLYALGATISQLLSGRPPDPARPYQLAKIRQVVPAALRETLSVLLDPEPRSRPSALVALRSLEKASSEAESVIGYSAFSNNIPLASGAPKV